MKKYKIGVARFYLVSHKNLRFDAVGFYEILSQFLYFILAKMMDTTTIFNYFEELLEYEPEKVEVLKALMDINGNENGIIDFIDYYGYDVDYLNSEIAERVENHR